MNKLLVALILTLPALAQAETLAILTAGPGYTSAQDAYSKVCTIDTEGHLNYSMKTPYTSVTKKRQMGALTLTRLKSLVEKLRSEELTVTPYLTGMGDLPGFELSTYPESEKTILLHADGKDAIRHSLNAQSVLRITARACGMTAEIIKQRLTEMRP